MSLLWGDYFPPGNVRRERTCRSEGNQVSSIGNEPSPRVTAKAGLPTPRLWKPTGHPCFPGGFATRVLLCQHGSCRGRGEHWEQGCSRVPVLAHSCARVPQTTSPECLILQRKHHTSNSKWGSGCPSPTEGAGGIGGELGTHGGCAQPGCSCSQQQSAASSLYTHLPRRPSGDIKDDCNHCLSRNTIYLWPSSHCPVWINQKENKALWKKDY